MATFVQLEEGHFNNDLLPPLRELFLETQVNKLIQEYLFSSNADEICTSLNEDSSERRENKAPDKFYAMDAVLRSACNAPCVKSTEAFDDNHPHYPHCKQNSQASLTLHTMTCIEDYGVNGKDQAVTSSALQTSSTAREASLIPLSVGSGGKLLQKTAHLSRVGTFPCTNKVQLQVGVPSKMNAEMQASCKKPPRPPKLPLPKSDLSSSLTRCCPDNGAYLQSSRRERKRKATATSSVNTSIWALLFTLCFAIIMIAQGFWSQDSQNFSAYGSEASSPMETLMRASTKQSPEEASLAGAAETQASMESVSAEREGSKEGVLAQSYVMRKVQLHYLADMKHLERDAFPTS